jgi:hypothetical protein
MGRACSTNRTIGYWWERQKIQLERPRRRWVDNIVTCFATGVRCLQVILTPTCRVSGYPRQVIKVATLLIQLRFIWTALPTDITLITIIPLGTHNTSSWYIFLRDDATPLVHLSSLMTAVCLSLSWLGCFTGLLPFLLCFLLLRWFLFSSVSFYYAGSFSTLLPFRRAEHQSRA